MKTYKNMYIIEIFFFFYTICLFVACHQSNTSLEDALIRSGDNRKELEKVLSFYSTEERDSLKLHAAIFLITNMPGHHYYDGELTKKFHDSVRVNNGISFFTKKSGDILLGQSALVKRTSRSIDDIKVITSGYLIQHIEASFRLRDKLPWLRETSFDNFLRYVLPYRIDKEPLDYWRDSLFIPERYLNTVLNNTSFSTLDIDKQLQDVFIQPGMNQDSVVYFLGEKFVLGCLERSNLEVFKLRVLGIPAAVDYLPFYANRNGFHGWVQRFLSSEKILKADLVENRKGAKIFRRTYFHNPVPLPSGNEFIPPLFLDSFYMDVTGEYLKTTDVALEIRDNIVKTRCQHVYLSVFNDLEWRPIWWAKQDDGKAIFKDMGRGVVYMPAYYTWNLAKYFTFPFVLDDSGNLNYLIPDTTDLQTLRLTRKYPRNEKLTSLAKSLVGIKIEASDDPTFNNPIMVLEIDSVTNLEYFSRELENPGKYRYFRCVGDNHEVAELVFMDKTGKRLSGIATSECCPYPSQILDGNQLSNTILNGRITIDFKEPVTVNKILVIPRNDGNGVFPGYKYELLYCNDRGWQSLGTRVATDVFIEFDNVPKGALYWLRNRSTGKEERIFTREDNKIRFW